MPITLVEIYLPNILGVAESESNSSFASRSILAYDLLIGEIWLILRFVCPYLECIDRF